MAPGYIHYCVFCGEHREADSAAMLQRSCPECGAPLRSCRREDYAHIAAVLAEQRAAHRPALDGAVPLVVLVGLPWLLDLVGIGWLDAVYAVAALFGVLATGLAFGSGDRRGEPRWAWRVYAAAAGATVATLLVGSMVLGVVAAALLLTGLVLHLVPRIRWARAERVLSVLQVILPVVAVTAYFVVVKESDALLVALVATGLVAFSLAGLLTAVGRRRQDRQIGLRLWLATAAALGASCLMTVGEPRIAAVAVAVAAWFVAGAAVAERPAPRIADLREPGSRSLWTRFAIPAAMLAALPTFAAVALDQDGAGALASIWFGGTFALLVLLVLGREVLVESARPAAHEMEALAGLAATLTQTLEETPVVEQALAVLHSAARATSSALHLREDERRLLRASAGLWQDEHGWADRLSGRDDVAHVVRGGRQVTRIVMRAHGHDIGDLTVVRPAADPLSDRDLELLCRLAEQTAVAIQNARDYRETLEQAVRDPLTGVYNRRYFFEALEKEVQRTRRYASQASLVLFDVDDFKRVNDTLGHAAGDEVLRAITEAAEPLLRPADSFARIGGDEFSLLLPETDQMQALLVAERIRAAITRAEVAPGVRVSVSAGVGVCPQDATTREDLVRRTDAALYWAKRNGKDLCAVVNETTDGAVATSGPQGETLVAGLDTLGSESEHVAAYAVALGRALRLPQDRLPMLRRAALLHDIGKVTVRTEVLDKPGPLDADELVEVRAHAAVGAAMLEHAGLTEEAAWVRHHHERWDGEGYPAGLQASDVPVEARIIAVADAFAAMTTDRPHRPALTTADALAELRAGAGTQFEPRLVKKFCGLVERGELSPA